MRIETTMQIVTRNPLACLLFALGFLLLSVSDRPAFAAGTDATSQTATATGLPLVATASDALTAEIDKAQRELDNKLRPSMGLYGSVFCDKNDITVAQGGSFATANFWDALNARLLVMTGQLHQDGKGSRRETNVWRTSVTLGFHNVFLTPRFVVWGDATYEGFALQSPERPRSQVANGRTPLYRGSLFGGKLGAKYLFENTSEFGVEAKRESLWAEHDNFDTRLYNRVEDMTKVATDMAINKARVFTNIVTWPEQQLHLDAGLDSMEDGNYRKWGYAHYQIPILWSRNKHWTAIRPNFYVESCDRQKSGYFSPRYHITTGLMLHTIQEFEHIDVEAEVNPQLLWTKDRTKKGNTQKGIHGLLNITYKYKDLRIGIGGFGYADTDDYWIYRGNIFIKYTF